MTRDIAIKCPVCLGKCKDENDKACVPCHGQGIVWGKETDDAPVYVPVFPQQPYVVPNVWPMVPPISWVDPMPLTWGSTKWVLK